MTLFCFPDFYPGELLFSACARWLERTMRRSDKHAVEELYGKNTVIAIIDLPSNLETFASRLPNPRLYPPMSVITSHTLLPYYAPFLTPERLQEVKGDMLGDKGPRIHMRVGVMASQVPQPDHLKLCNHCVVEDRARNGECFWHREHQAPGVLLCAKHRSILAETSVLIRNRKTRYRFITAEIAYREKRAPAIDTEIPLHFGLLRSIAVGTSWLLEQRELCPGLEYLQERYLQALTDLGYTTAAGRVRVDQLCTDFRGNYPAELLQVLGCDVPQTVTDNWLVRLVRKPDGIQQPLRHLVLMDFLGVSPAEFFGRKPTSDEESRQAAPSSAYIAVLPFRASSTQQGTIVTAIEDVLSIGEQPSDKSGKWRRTGRWDRRKDDILRRLWSDPRLSLREKARRLGVDPLTVKRHALRLGLTLPEGMSGHRAHLVASRADKAAILLEKCDIYRAKWAKLMTDNEGCGVKKLRELAPDIYAWLYRHDRQWLREHVPARVTARKQGIRVDWHSRDRILSEAAKTSAQAIVARSGRPSQLTVASIGREVGQLALIQQHMGKLPLTSQVLESLCETGEEFAIRRLHWAADYYEQMEQTPGRKELVRKAGVSRYMSNERVLAVIDDLLSRMQPPGPGHNGQVSSCSRP